MRKKIIWNDINKKSIPHILHQPIWLYNSKETILCSRINNCQIVFAKDGNYIDYQLLISAYKITHWAYANQELEYPPKFNKTNGKKTGK